MRFSVELDDRTKEGKELVEVVKNMAKLNKSIKIDKFDDDAREDSALLSMMEEARKSGYADTEVVLKRFGIK